MITVDWELDKKRRYYVRKVEKRLSKLEYSSYKE